VRSEPLAPLPAAALRVAQVLALFNDRLALEALAAAAELDGPTTLAAIDALRMRGLIHVADGEAWLAGARAAIEATLDGPTERHLYLSTGRALLALGAEDKLLWIAASLLRGGDRAAGAALLTRALKTNALGVELGVDSADAMPLLEELLALRRAAGESDEQCIDLLAPLTSAGYYGDYRMQCLHGDRALAALLTMTGLALAKRAERIVGGKLGLLLGLAYAGLRRLFSRRGRSLGELLKSLLAVASGSAASAVSAFETSKAFAIVDSLSPFAALPERSGPRVAYEFVRGTAEVGIGRAHEAAQRYRRLGEILARDEIPGLPPATVEIFRLASLYGRAQSELTSGSPAALELAERLTHGHPFYLAPAEMTRMAYFASRGEQDLADRCRERAELAALRNGMSWAALATMNVRCVYAYALARNDAGLMQAAGELARLSSSAPALALFRDVAEAYAALLEGRAEDALERFERVLQDPRHGSLPSAWLNRTFHAEALRVSGRHEQARERCLALIAERALYVHDQRHHLPAQQLALVEAQLGELAAASARLDACLRELPANPLLLGSAHRDRARIALWASDHDAFTSHLRAMSVQFQATRNPWLIRQCDQLLGEQRGEARPAATDDGDEPDLDTVIE
jgi:hypothetical protein